MVNVNVRNFRRFLFGMRPDVPAFNVHVFTSDFKFKLLIGSKLTNVISPGRFLNQVMLPNPA